MCIYIYVYVSLMVLINQNFVHNKWELELRLYFLSLLTALCKIREKTDPKP